VGAAVHSDPAIVGSSLTLNDERTRSSACCRPSFDFASVFAPGGHFDLYFPFPLSPETNRWGNTMAMIGRLKPGSPRRRRRRTRGDRRAADARASRSQLFEGFVKPLADQVNGRMRLALWVLAGAVGW
jgi:hypothetical protein